MDYFDKRLSSPLFCAKVPRIVEYIWSIPGNFFGNLLFSMLVSPSLLSLYISSERGYLVMLITISLLITMLILWFTAMQGHKISLRILYWPELGLIVAPIVSIFLLLTFHEKEASKVGLFQISAWLAAEMPIIILKPLVGRTRPGSCDEFRNGYKKTFIGTRKVALT